MNTIVTFLIHSSIPRKAWRLPSVIVLLSIGMLCAIDAHAQLRSLPKSDYAIALVLRWEGFEPSSITMPPGKNFIAVFNRTGLPEIDLRIVRTGGAGEANEILADRKSPREERNWNEVVSLSAGEYEIREANHPQWVFRLSVAPDAWRGRRTRDAGGE